LAHVRTHEPRRGLGCHGAARDAGITFFDDARYSDETGSAPILTGYSQIVFGDLFVLRSAVDCPQAVDRRDDALGRGGCSPHCQDVTVFFVPAGDVDDCRTSTSRRGEMAINAEQWVRDRAEIEELMALYARGNDVSWRYNADWMADDMEVDYGSNQELNSAVLAAFGPRDESAPDEPGLRGFFTFTQHFVTNAIIEVDGDTGRGEYYVSANHGLIDKNGKPAVVPVGAVYTQDVVRTPKGWRVKRHKCRILWVHDPEGLMPPVTASMWDDPSRKDIFTYRARPR
jgi:hypothetical protein